MDLLLISRCPPFPLYHGDRLIPFHIARELSARRHRIDLLAFYDNPADLAEIPRYEQHFRSVTLIREPRRSLWSYWLRAALPGRRFPRRAGASWSPEMWRAIQAKLGQHTYDAVHLFGGVQVYEYHPLAAPLPNVIVPYESYSLWLERAVREARSPLARAAAQAQRGMARRYESFMFDRFDRVVVLTDRDAEALKALNPATPTVTIPNGVDIDFFTPTGYEPDEPALLFTGNFDYPPNLDAALRLVRDIFPRVKQAVPAARLTLVGGNPPPALRAYARDDIEITGRVPDLRPYFECALVYVSPLRLGAGIKNKVLETLAMQTPVVATPLSCDGIPVEHGEHVLLATHDDEFVAQIVALLQDPALRARLAQNGRRLVEDQFTWQRVADLYEELYLRVIRERHDAASD
ncbi:MAG: glycosyltransferase [Chloroflexota bacterium]